MPTTTEHETLPAFAVSLKAGSLDCNLEQESRQLAAVLHELFTRTEALRKFEDGEVMDRQSHQYRTALYFAAVARSKACDALRERGFPV